MFVGLCGAQPLVYLWMDFDNESLLDVFIEEEEKNKLIEWNQENDHKRSDIFEYRLEEGDKLREEGNGFFKAAEYDSALHRYLAAIYHLDFDIGQQWNLMEHHQKDLNTRKLKALSNVCAAYLKKANWQNTKKAADVGLRHLEKSGLKDTDAESKFHYRKGLANLERGFHEDAYAAFKTANTLTPGEKNVQQALKQASDGKKVDHQKAKEVWQNKLLSEEEKDAQGLWYKRATILARLRLAYRLGLCHCCRRKKTA